MNRKERHQRNIKILKAIQRYPRPTYEELAEEFGMSPSGVSRALGRIIEEMPADKLEALYKK